MATSWIADNQNRSSRRRSLGLFLAVLSLAVVLNFGYMAKQVEYLLGLTGGSSQLPPVRLEQDRISIPSLDISAPIVFPDSTDDATFSAALHTGVVHYPGTANIGEKGNAFLFGHSSDYLWVKDPYRNVFALLPKISAGDSIYVSNGSGKTFRYIVQETHIASPSDTQYLDQRNHTGKFLTLQTSYPVGTALKRFIVIATLAP